MCPDLEQAGTSTRKLFRADGFKVLDPQLPSIQLAQNCHNHTQIATFRTTVKRTTTHHVFFLPKDYSGSPTASIYNPWAEVEAVTYLISG